MQVLETKSSLCRLDGYISSHIQEFSGGIQKYGNALDITEVIFGKPVSFISTNKISDIDTLARHLTDCGVIARNDRYRKQLVVARDEDAFNEYKELIYPEGVFGQPSKRQRGALTAIAHLFGLTEYVHDFVRDGDWCGVEDVIREALDFEIVDAPSESKGYAHGEWDINLSKVLGYPESSARAYVTFMNAGVPFNEHPLFNQDYKTLNFGVYQRRPAYEVLDKTYTKQFRTHLPQLAETLELNEVI